MKIVDCEQCKGDGCPNCDGYGYYAVHETTGGKSVKATIKNSNPTQDLLDAAYLEIHELRRENIALAAKVQTWEAVGRELVNQFDIELAHDGMVLLNAQYYIGKEKRELIERLLSLLTPS